MEPLPIEDGCFVWTLFPFGPPNRPDEPGPVRHVGYVLGVDEGPKPPRLLLAYTSSGAWGDAAERRPFGVIEFDVIAARALGQKPFYIDLRCVARLPMTAKWFPDLRRPGHGVVGIAGTRLRASIDAALKKLVERNADLIEVRGPR